MVLPATPFLAANYGGCIDFVSRSLRETLARLTLADPPDDDIAAGGTHPCYMVFAAELF